MLKLLPITNGLNGCSRHCGLAVSVHAITPSATAWRTATQRVRTTGVHVGLRSMIYDLRPASLLPGPLALAAHYYYY